MSDEAAAAIGETMADMAVGGAGLARRTTLGDYVGGRDNNFNLIRFLAAACVLLSHSFPLSNGDATTEPLRYWLGLSAGEIAVDVFFLTSGFLVAGSLLLRHSVPGFAIARALRIYPAMVVSVLLTVLVVGLWFSSSTPSSFATSPETWRYIVKNATLVTGVSYTLPGAFEHTPVRLAVNGSLWTLPYELAMYGILAAAWLAMSALRLRPEKRFGGAMAFFFLVAVSIAILRLPTHWIEPAAWHLGAMFFAGSSLYAVRKHVLLDVRLFFVFLTLLGLSCMNKTTFAVVYLVTLPYLVLYLAYVPGGVLRRFNRLGDYSYGIYIYAFPVQQMLAASLPGIQPVQMLTASFAITIALAIASWHLCEKRTLALKKAIA